MSHMPINVNFGGEQQALTGDVEWKSPRNSLKKAAIAGLITWLIGALFILVPIAHWTIPPLFLVLGPIISGLVYFQNKNVLERLDADTICPNCKQRFRIHETDVAPPIYGMCSNCKAGYQVHIPDKEIQE